MKAVTWHGRRDVRVDNVPDPTIQEPTDAIISVTSSGLCGSDLHLYELFGAFMEPGDILGHEPMGIVEDVGPAVDNIKPGDRVVIPFNVSCGHCHMCDMDLYAQCETTQNTEHGTGASLLGYTKLYGQVDGGQAELNANEYDNVPDAIRDKTDGRGPDSVIDAVGMEAHGAPFASLTQKATTMLPDRIAGPLMKNAGIDRRNALLDSFDTVRRGGTVSISGVYAGQVDPIPMFDLFDKGITIRMGQAHVRRWTDSILPLLLDDSDPLGTEQFATHHVPLESAADAYRTFQKKQDNAIKILFKPGMKPDSVLDQEMRAAEPVVAGA